MSEEPDAAGHAALAIVESLLLVLSDRRILPEREIVGVLTDATAVHEDPPDLNATGEIHMGVATLIRNIISGGSSGRRK
jgi:hypothetical protein